jgi:hypothetical protein
LNRERRPFLSTEQAHHDVAQLNLAGLNHGRAWCQNLLQ